MTQAPNDANSRTDDAVDATDTEALLRRYREERAKRLREDGNQQFRSAEAALARYADDPWSSPGFSRNAVHEDVDVIVIGGGLGGLLIAVRLIESGITNLRLIEKGADFGGTWYWNRYPGAACDIESYIYMPLLEELGYIPREKYASAPEIFAHCQAIGRAYDLYSRSLLRTAVVGLRWSEDVGRWTVETEWGDAISTRFVCIAAGPLLRPKLPAIPGIEHFRGRSFHTSRWDYAYTGGDAHGNLPGLLDKRVGVIGTGATAVQCVPALGRSAKHLYVFQRTPSSVGVRANRPTDPQWAATLKPGWQKKRMENFCALISGIPQKEDLVQDGWTEGFQRLLSNQNLSIGDHEEVRQKADILQMNQIRARVDAVVRDKATAAALKPFYNWFCKRPCFHDEYLDSFNRPNVTLVDTQGRGVERITERGAVVAGIEYPLDCLIYATGFEFGTGHTRELGYEIYGRRGISQSAAWQGGVKSLHGMHSRGFPNRFILCNAHSAPAVNYTVLADEVGRHLAYIIKHCLDHQIRTVEPFASAEEDWVHHVMSFADASIKFASTCTPSFLNSEGQASRLSVQNGFYLGGQAAYVSILRKWRENGDLAGLELERFSDLKPQRDPQ